MSFLNYRNFDFTQINMNPNAAPAQILYVELTTRITSQTLHYRSGSEETAAVSVSSVFATTRKLLVEHGDALAFERVAQALLNSVTRPYTARWHGWMTEDARDLDAAGKPSLKFRDERVRRMFRAELIELQRRLQPYLRMLRSLISAADGKDNVEDILDAADLKQLREVEAFVLKADLGEPINAGIGNEIAIAGDITGASVFAKERETISKRRKALKLSHADDADDKLLNAAGLALSGGGIRSATFCLGIVQVLQKKGLLLNFDYLSTVSGGGYLGAFLSCSLGTDIPKYIKTGRERAEDAFQRTGEQTESRLLRHLRNNSKYLLNGGLLAKLQIVGLMLSGFLWNVLMVIPIPLVAALSILGLQETLWGKPVESLGEGSPFPPLLGCLHGIALTGLACLTFVLWVLLPPIQRLTHGLGPDNAGRKFRSGMETLAAWLGFTTLLVGAFYLLPALIHGYAWLAKHLHEWNPAWLKESKLGDIASLSTGGVLSIVLGFLATWITPRLPMLRTLALKLFILSGPVLMLLAFLVVCHRLGMGTGQVVWTPVQVGVGTALIALWGWGFVNINTLAPHRYYRNKLCECYLTRRTADEKTGRIQSLQQVKLSSLKEDDAAPYHLINMTLNTPTSANKDLRGRASDFFLASKHFVGSPLTGYQPTDEVEKVDPHFDLGTAMAVSGAAASTSMGWKSLPQFRFLMSLFNIRLGYWLRKPGTTALPKLLEGAGPWYFFREMFGRMDENCRYVNLSDGGHIENLAAYELLRRKCKFIVCVDGGQEPGMECSDLVRLERYATIDLDIAMHYNIGDLKPQSNGLSRSHAILVKIEYDASTPNKQLGWMLYLKLAVTGVEPVFVRDYRRENPAFPHQTTGDQFFDEEQFEAYRALGACAMEGMLREEIMGNAEPNSIENWFQCLANNLLPDNDTAFKQ